MSENAENPILQHLKKFQSGQDRIERDLREIKTRLGAVEAVQGSILQHTGHLSSAVAAQQIAFNRMNEHIDRIEHRLELA